MTNIEELKDVIRGRYGVESRHVASVLVKESPFGHTFWEGYVEVFDLIGHPTAPRAYAWAVKASAGDSSPRRLMTVLHVPPMTSAGQAVRIALAQETRNPAAKAAPVDQK